MLQLALTSDTQPLSVLFDRANTPVAAAPESIAGRCFGQVSGSAQPAVRVDVNLHQLNAMGLSSNELRNALTAANVTSPQGFLSDGKTRVA